MRSGIYFNNRSLIMFEVLVYENYAIVESFIEGKEHSSLITVQELLAGGEHIEYLGEV